MNFRELGLEIINEVARRNSNSEKEKNLLLDTWLSMYNGLTQGKEDREVQFIILSDKYYPIGKVFSKLRKWIIENRELDIESILEEIHKAEACSDMKTLADIVGEVFLENVDVEYVKDTIKSMEKQGWTWDRLIYTYAEKNSYRVQRFLNIPYDRYVEI